MGHVLIDQEGKPVFAASTGRMEWNHTGSWRYMRPRYENKLPPCTQGCPTHEKIPQYFAQVKRGDYRGAWEIILEDNPLPGVCGRVCYHPCEDVCNRGEFDERIAINALERFVADQNLDRRYPASFRQPSNGVNIAIVGSGPAGLSAAYQLARRGTAVTIFEAAAEPGGMLRLGIPEYRLPRHILDKEIHDIQSLGVEIRTGQRLGTDITLEDLQNRFDAVILALGAYRGRAVDLPGRHLKGVRSALDFLRELNTHQPVDLPERVTVIGGGNTAIDAARSARRLGADVTILYRRSRTEMPAVREEIEAALEEGIDLKECCTPVEVLGDESVRGLRWIKTRLGEPDDSGRRRPIPIPGSEAVLETGAVLLAIGELPELESLPALGTTGSRIAVNDHYQTNLEGVYACGDVADGPVGTVVDAIATGKATALAVLHSLLDQKPAANQPPVVTYDQINLDYFRHQSRPALPHLDVRDAVQSFTEVNQTLSPDTAEQEAVRCFSCGTCIECDLCLIYCPDVAITRGSNGVPYVINYDFCKGCGVCVEECPREAMTFEEELSCTN